VVSCLAVNGGNYNDCAIRATLGVLPPEGQRAAQCLVSTHGDVEACAARQVFGMLSAQAQRVVSCLANSGGNIVGCGTNEVLKNILPPDGQRIAGCLVSTGGNVAACGVNEAINELQKCQNGIGKPGGCFGPNGEGMKFVRNNIAGPIGDVASGHLGGSSESVWRKAGLPEVRLW